MPNRLADQTSPYLLSHADNPVDWYPWGTAALAKAKSEDKPIFLSVGYSACHWCHVMAHESFENQAIAEVLNRDFVSIKVDREERPDLDQIYMHAVQMMTGRGGWPMSVFLTPDGEPFFGGTYWPATSSRGMPGFDQVLSAVLEAWKHRRDDALQAASRLRSELSQSLPVAADVQLSAEQLTHAAAALERSFDHQHGGFGDAPKFPHPIDLRVLLRVWRHHRRDGLLGMVTSTLDHMAAGGIYDHLGGGFHRYAVDARWLVPHFEKMLYDNALLATCYTEAYQVTGNPDYARVVRETLDYLLRDMQAPDGGLASAEDADSEGVEGKFYVWSPEEVHAVLGGQRADLFAYCYEVSPQGNFEGHSILNLPKTLDQCATLRSLDVDELQRQMAACRAELLAARAKRVRPARDDKVLVSWNALAIEALALAAGAFGEPRWLAAAESIADFLLARLRRDDGRLLHCYRQGQAKFDAYLDDYAGLCAALVTLYEADFREAWIDGAVELADVALAHFEDTESGGFFYTADDHEQLIARNKDYADSSVPSGNAMAATALVRLAELTGRDDYRAAAERTLRAFASVIDRVPAACGQMLVALDGYAGPARQIAVLGDCEDADTREVLADLRRRFIPNAVVACRASAEGPADGSRAIDALFAGKQPAGDASPTVYVCENFTCRQPASGKAAVLKAWAALDSAPVGSA